MHKILTALVFSFAFWPALADQRPATQAAEALQGGLMQANLVTQAAPRKADPVALKGSLAAAARPAAQAPEPEDHHTTSGMLLAALALMAGIVLRRWGDTGQ